MHTVVGKINLISLQFSVNVYYFYHTNANVLDPARIRGNTVYTLIGGKIKVLSTREV